MFYDIKILVTTGIITFYNNLHYITTSTRQYSENILLPVEIIVIIFTQKSLKIR